MEDLILLRVTSGEVLKALFYSESSLDIKQVASRLNMAPESLRSALPKLVDMGYVVRERIDGYLTYSIKKKPCKS